jgi:hypothetical protein
MQADSLRAHGSFPSGGIGGPHQVPGERLSSITIEEEAR